MSELKPCPFCGKQPRVTLTSDGIVTGIQCDNRKCSGDFSILEVLSNNEIMVRTWNTRPIEDALRADAERLAKALNILMEFHPEDELGPTTEDYWSPEYKAAMDTAHKALAEHQRGEG